MSLRTRAIEIVECADLTQKTQLAYDTAKKWFGGELSRCDRAFQKSLPQRPGRPASLILLPVKKMPKRKLGGKQGKIAHIHALAHIELNAVDLTWDLIGRFCGENLPPSFFHDWVRVGLEEAKHFSMLRDYLQELGSFYGALPAHDGLWQACQETAHSLLARLAIIPLVLEARGLDITPPMIEKAKQAGDHQTARYLDIIYRDEKNHVAFGTKWFHFMCDREGLEPIPTFHHLVRTHFRGQLKPPFNDKARAEAGLTPGFYKPLSPIKGD